MIYGRQLSYFLKQRKLSAAELSRQSGIAKQTISEWLQGAEPRSISSVKRVAQVLSVSIDVLYSGSNYENGVGSFAPSYHFHDPGNEFTSFSIRQDGRFNEVSDDFCKWVGWSEAELVGQTINEFTHYLDRSVVDLFLLDRSEREMPVQESEFRFFCKSGLIKWFRCGGISLRHEKKLYIVCKDVSNEYPLVSEPKSIVSLNLVVRNAFENIGRIARIRGVRWDVQMISGKLVVECQMAQASAALAGLLRIAATQAVVRNEKVSITVHPTGRRTIHLDVLSPTIDENSYLTVVSHLFQSQGTRLEVTNLDSSKTRFRIEMTRPEF